MILLTYEEMQKSHNDLNIVELDLSAPPRLKGFYYAGNIRKYLQKIPLFPLWYLDIQWLIDILPDIFSVLFALPHALGQKVLDLTVH